MSSEEHSTERRGPLTWLVAVAAAVVIAGAVVFAMTRDVGSPGPPAPPAGGTDQPPGAQLRVSDSDQSGRCLPPSPRALEGAGYAFDGVVTGVADGQATLVTNRWYAGSPTSQVTVEAPSEDMQALLAAVRFEKGERYLVAASGDGRVMLCGFSAPYSERLARVYDTAFNG